MKPYISIIIYLFCGLINSQTMQDENLAQEYYKQGEYKKASTIFQSIYKNKKTKNIYIKYVDCLMELEEYKKAERIIKSFYKKHNDPTILIDLGTLYLNTEDRGNGEKQFTLAIELGKKNPRYLSNIANKFYKNGHYELALEAYQLAKKNNNKANYGIQISNIYSQIGNIEEMYKELINLLDEFPHYYQTCKNKLRRTITEDSENPNNKTLNKLLIKHIQKNNSYESSKLLVWLFIQENRFESALDYEISIDKRFEENKTDILTLGDITFKNQDYKTATKAFKYILNKSHKNSYAYEYSAIQLLNIDFLILKDKKQKTKIEIKKLIDQYENHIQVLGIKSETIQSIKNYTYILSNYLNKADTAMVFLKNAIDSELLNSYDVALCKMELAKILLHSGSIWESVLIYAQVEKEFKEDIIGQQAKLEKIKINYYSGDFEWAQNQLKVLTLSTSKLIANNAMSLSLLIGDNLNLDTTDSALLLYAKAELLFEQKKYQACLDTLNNLEKKFPQHTLIDELLFKKSNVFLKTEEYDKAIECLDMICTEHYYDVLYDDALFQQAEIYQYIIDDSLKAREKYEELILKNPNSIFINDARNRYRKLRDNNFLLLE